MYINGFDIEGFGLFHNYSAENLSLNLNLFYGPNESGKSTIRDFILSLLFGFSRPSDLEYHEPLNGGIYGGRLVFTDDNLHTFTIERLKDNKNMVIRDGGNKEIDAEIIRQSLGGIDRDLFSHVFAFGLKELADLATLTAGKVSEMIFSAGIMGAGKSVTDADAVFAKRQNDSVSKRQRSVPPPINLTYEKIKELHNNLKIAKKDQGNLATIKSEIDTVVNNIYECNNRSTGYKLGAARLESAIKLHPRILEKNLLSTIQNSLTTMEHYRQILNHSDQIASLVKNKTKYLGDIERLSLIAEKEKRATEEIEEIENKLGITASMFNEFPNKIDLASVEKYKLSLDNILAEIKSEENNLEGFEQSIHETTLDITRRQEELLSEIDNAITTFRETRLGNILPVIIIDSRQGNTDSFEQHETTDKQILECGEKLINLNKFTLLKQKLDILALKLDDLSSKKHELENIKTQIALTNDTKTLLRSRKMLTRGVITLLLVPTILMLIIGIALYLSHKIPLALLAFVSTFCSAILIIYIQLISKKKNVSATEETTLPNNKDSAYDIEKLLLKLREKEQESRRLEKEIDSICELLLIDNPPTAAAIQTFRDRLHQLDQIVADLNKYNFEMQKLTDKYHASKAKLSLYDNEKNLLEEKLTCIAHQYQLTNENLGREIDLTLLPGILRELLALYINLQSRNLLATEIASLDRDIQNFEINFEYLLEQLSVIFSGIADNLLKDLELDAEKYNSTSTMSKTKLLDYAPLAKDFSHHHKESGRELINSILLHSKYYSRDSLKLSATIDNLDSLFAIARKWEVAVSEIKTLIDASINDVTKAQADQDIPDEYLTMLEAGDLTTLQAMKDKNDSLSAEEGKTITELENGKRHLEERYKALVSPNEIADMEIELAQKQSLLDNLLGEYAMWGLARFMLNHTLDRYQEERQPAILTRAGELLSLVTDGKYSKVLIDEESLRQQKKRVSVINPRGKQFKSDHLSQGTKEQLYLCLRIAYAESFAAQSKVLPLIFDDILVNFDLQRAGKTIKAIVDSSSSRQIIAFTCHRHIKDLFLAENKEIKVFELTDSH